MLWDRNLGNRPKGDSKGTKSHRHIHCLISLKNLASSILKPVKFLTPSILAGELFPNVTFLRIRSRVVSMGKWWKKKSQLKKDYQLDHEPKGASVLWTAHLALGSVSPSSATVMSLFSLPCYFQASSPHHSFLLSPGTTPSPPSSYRFLDPLLLHRLILNTRIPVSPYSCGTRTFTLLHRAPGTLSAPSPIPGWGQESLWLQRRPSTFDEIAFLPFTLADEMSRMEKMESLMEECVGRVVLGSASGSPKLAVTIGRGWWLSQHREPRKWDGAKTAVTNHYFSSLFSHYFLGWEIAFVKHCKIEATFCATVMVCLSFTSDGCKRTWFWISSINDRFTPPCDEGQGREEGEGGNGRCRGLENSIQKFHFQLPAQKQPQLAMAQSHFLLSVMTLVVALHLLDRQPKKNPAKSSLWKLSRHC